jgi:hypothetical protein
MAFHHGENPEAWRFALSCFACERKGLTCRDESRKAGEGGKGGRKPRACPSGATGIISRVTQKQNDQKII